MLKSLSLLSAASLLSLPHSLTAQDHDSVTRIAISTDPAPSQPAGLSKGFSLEQIAFDASGSIASEKQKSGIEFSSFKPGNVWSGELPPFFNDTIVIGGEDEFPITDVTSSGSHLFGYYGLDHYQTRVVSVVDKNRKNPYELTAYSLKDVAFCALEDGILYYTTVEKNLDEKHNARLHAFSLKEKKQLWETGAGVAHGNFLIFQNHILTHWGFTAADDFICVIDRGSGKVLKKEKLKTAANCLILEEDGTITVPAYTGVYRYRFTETGTGGSQEAE